MSIITNAIRKANDIHLLVDIDFSGTRKRYSFSQLNIPRNNSSNPAYVFDGKIIEIGNIGNVFDINNFRYSLQNVSITIANSYTDTNDRLQDLEALKRLDGSIGSIYIWCSGLTWEDIQTEGLLFSGIFQKQYHNSEEYCFSLIDRTESQFDTIPNIFINSSSFPNFKDDSTGSGSVGNEPIPMIFGDWPKGVKLIPVDVSNFIYLISSNIVRSDQTAFYHSATEYLFANSGATYIFTASGATIGNTIDAKGNVYSYIKFDEDQTASEPIQCSIQGIRTGTSVISHPSEITEYIFDNYTNFKRGSIEYGSIRQIKNILPGIKYTSCINDNTEGSDIIDRLLNPLLCARINTIGGKIGVMHIDFNGPVIATYTKSNNCISDDIRIEKTPYNLIVNDIIISYGPNVATGKFDKTLYINKDTNSKCLYSYIEYGKRPTVKLTLSDVWDESTALTIINRYLDFYSLRHDVLVWEVSYEDGFDVKEGSIVLITLPEGPSINGNGWAEEKFILLQRIFLDDRIRQVLWKINTFSGAT